MKHTVTLFKSTKEVQIGYNRDVSFVLERIRSGSSKKSIEKIRKSKNKEERDKLKLNLLPVICFNGTFRYRSGSAFIAHSGLCILDFDKIPDSEMTAMKDSLTGCEYTFACFLSPSGNGFKVLFRIPAEADKHKGYFDAIVDFLGSSYQDKLGSYLASPCYESYDPDIYINPGASIWTKCDMEEIDDVGVSQPNFPVTSENRIVTNLMDWWKKKFGAAKGERNGNLFKLAKAFNDFGVNASEAMQVLLGFVQKDFNESEIKNIHKSAYRDKSTFGTKFFEDHETKRKIEKMIRAGKKMKDIVIALPDTSKELIEKGIETIKETLAIDDFWEYDENGKIKLIPHKFKFWLQQNNYFKYYPTENSNTYSFIVKDQNLLEETGDKRMKDFVLSTLLNRSDIGFYPYDYMASNQKFFTSDYLSFLETAKVDLKKDTEKECFIYFRNCAAKVTDKKIEIIDYIDIDGFVWKGQLIDNDFEKLDHHESEFRTFVWFISGQNVERYNTFKSVIGYLMHSFKNSSNNKAVIFNDELISENPNGGSGKGILWRAIKQMKRVARIDGKKYDPSKSFEFQTVKLDSQVLVFDDVKKNFNFENLFSVITEGITIEYKGQDAVQLPIEDSPKIVITTNYTVGGVGGSFLRRKFEVEFSSYFNETHTPADEFGHQLIDDWDDKEMNRFYSYMLSCCQYYLQNGLKSYEHKNLPTRKFIKETSHEFYEWANDENIPKNVRIDRKELYSSFLEEYGDLKKWLQQRRFTSWIKSYATHIKVELLSGKTNGVWWMTLKDENFNDAQVEDKDGLPF